MGFLDDYYEEEKRQSDIDFYENEAKKERERQAEYEYRRQEENDYKLRRSLKGRDYDYSGPSGKFYLKPLTIAILTILPIVTLLYINNVCGYIIGAISAFFMLCSDRDGYGILSFLGFYLCKIICFITFFLNAIVALTLFFGK